MARILVAEDNEAYRRLLAIHLTRAGYDVLEAADGAQALERLRTRGADAIVADMMMPHMDGLSLLSSLRRDGVQTPVLIVTAKEQFDAMRQSFQSGADDYLVKPVRMEELLLRLEALLRRCEETGTQKNVRVGSCLLDATGLCVRCGERCVSLRLKEFRLLAKLAAHPDRIFTRQELMDDVWGYDSRSDPRTVDTHIKRLREKLEDFPEIRIQTVRGLGYRVGKAR